MDNKKVFLCVEIRKSMKRKMQAKPMIRQQRKLIFRSENNRWRYYYNIPSRAPKARPVSAPPLLMLPTAAIDEKISGAPLPKASRVTPCRISVKEISYS